MPDTPHLPPDIPSSLHSTDGMHVERVSPTDISDVETLGRLLRTKRRQDGLTQADLADIAGLSRRFIIDCERGKPTAEIGKMLQLLAALGLQVRVGPRGSICG